MKRPFSMTAYGRGDAAGTLGSWTVEVRSVNHKFFDPSIKLPRKYFGLEDRVKRVVASHYSRGHVDVFINPGPENGDAIRLRPNLPLARDYYQSLTAISEELGLADRPSLALIAACKDVVLAHEEEADLDAVWPTVEEALQKALAAADAMRADEGQALYRDLSERLREFERKVDGINRDIPELLERRQEKLKERLAVLLEGVAIDPIRLAQEVAIMADKADVTEELVRLKSHISQFAAFLAADEPVGRRLDFLLQEFLREINTLASKINDAATAHLTVELKTEVERLREQVQNLE